MKIGFALVLVLVLGTVVPGTLAGTAMENEAPLVDAGLDQTVSVADTVLLDGGGSRDPDGSIESYAWRITAPNGTAVAPDCASCERTTFVASQAGIYEVELTVTDDDGASRSDTLYVTAESAGGPTVALGGPGRTEEGRETPYVATAEARAAPLTELVWRVDGTVVHRDDIAGEHAQPTLRWSFSTAGEVDLSVTVVDAAGRSATDHLTVSVTDPSSPPTSPPANDAPDVTLSGPATVVQGSTGEFEAIAHDGDGRIVSYSWTTASRSGASGAARATHEFTEPVGSTVAVTVTVTDDDGETASTTHFVEVLDESGIGSGGGSGNGSDSGNEPPSVTISAPDHKTACGDTTVELSMDATDPDGWVTSTSWSGVDRVFGQSASMSVNTADDGDSVRVEVSATDNDGGKTSTYKEIGLSCSEGGTAPSIISVDAKTEGQIPTGDQSNDIFGGIVSEADDRITFTVRVKPMGIDVGEDLVFKFIWGDGTSATITREIKHESHPLVAEAAHNYRPFDSKWKNRTFILKVVSPRGLTDKVNRKITFKDSQGKPQKWGVDVEARGPFKYDQPGKIVVSDTTRGKTPPQIKVIFGDGTSDIFRTRVGGWSKILSKTYDEGGNYTIQAIGMNTSSDGYQQKAGTTSIHVISKSYTVYHWNSIKEIKKSITKTAIRRPGIEWDFVKVVSRQETPTGQTLEQPAGISDPSAPEGYIWKFKASWYDPLMGATIEKYEKYEVIENIKWEKSWTVNSKGSMERSISKPKRWYGDTLSSKSYKCKNENAPLHEAGCGD